MRKIDLRNEMIVSIIEAFKTKVHTNKLMLAYLMKSNWNILNEEI